MDAAVYKKLLDIENQKENPFNTSVGQDVVSTEENYWARKLRHGRTAYKIWDNIALNAVGSATSFVVHHPSVNKIFIPRFFTFSSTVACTLQLTYQPYKDYDGFAGANPEYFMHMDLPANQPFTYQFNGELQIVDIDGYIAPRVTALSGTGGTAKASIWGIEVSVNA